MCHACIGVIVSQTQPLVSVLVPICNVEKYLDECLSSLKNQTLKDIEIICINDGSTDSSLEIINGFASEDPRFVVIDKPNSGYGDSMNRGLEIAKGKYISILESDDFLDADALEFMVQQAEDNELDLFKCNFWLYWSSCDSSRLNRHDAYFPAMSQELIGMGVHKPIDAPDAFWAKPSIWSALYRKDFLSSNNISFLPTPGASFQDTSFTFKVLACARRAMYSGKAFLHYRQDNEHSSVNNPGKVFCVCDEHHEMSRFLNEDRPDLKPALDPIRAKVKFYNYDWNLNRLAPELRRDFISVFSSEMAEELQSNNIICAEAPFDRYGFNPVEFARAKDFAENADLLAVQYSLMGSGKFNTIREYFAAGGFSMVVRMMKRKLRR